MKSKYKIHKLGEHIKQVLRKNKKDNAFTVFSVTNTSGFIKSDEYFSKEVFSKKLTNYNIVNPGEFAYNPSRINVGSIDYLNNNEPVLVSPLYNVFQTSEIIDNNYLKYFVKSNYGLSQIDNLTTGSVRDSLKYSALERMKIPVPPLDDQVRIASLLSRIEGLIAKRKESIALLDEYVKSVFLEMFGDPVRNEKGWDVVSIEEIASKEKYSLSSGPFGSNLTSKHYTEKGVIILRGKNISSGKLNLDDIKFISEAKAVELKRSEVKPDDIVIIAVGTSGYAFKIPIELNRAIISQNFNKITPDKEKILPIVLEFIINSEYVQNQFQKEITDTVRTFLSLTKIKQIKIPLPSLKVQEKFVSVIEKVEAMKVKYQESLSGLEELYGSVSQRAFRGEI